MNADSTQPWQIARALKTAASRDAGHTLLNGLTVAQLKAVAVHADAYTGSATRKADIARRIVDSTVGSRLDIAAIRGGNW